MATICVVIDVAQEWLLFQHCLEGVRLGLQASVWDSACAECARLASFVGISEFGDVLDDGLDQANHLSPECAAFGAYAVVVIAHWHPLAQRGLRRGPGAPFRPG